jgi:two-component system NtrC family sensor kinase
LASIDLAIVGDIYQALGNYKLATEYFKSGVELSERDGDTYFRARLYNNLANLFDKLGKPDSCIYFAQEALQISQINKYLNYKLNSAKILARVYESQDKVDSVVKYLKMTMATTDSIFGQEKIRQFQTMGFIEEQRQQELNITKERYKNQIQLYTLLGTLGLFLVVALILYRNNIEKKRANMLLEKQKNEIDRQRSIAEKTLEELKSTQAQLIQSEKMASLGQLTAGIAHEIQNPLNFVNNFSEVNDELIQEMKDETDIYQIKIIVSDIQQNNEKISLHGKRADAIVKGMLQHSRTSTGQKELADINALADEYLRLSYHGIRAKDKNFNVEIKTDFDGNIGKINVVPQDIGRVLLNLFNNAFYAVSERRASTSSAGQSYEPVVSICTKKVDTKVEIRVKDNGNGIPQKVVDKIFQPFFTTKPTGQGTGLGLSLSYDIIKAHGGEIKVESKENEGSEFIIHLPINNFL